MRFANLLCAVMLLFALAGAAAAKSIEPAGLRTAPRIETIAVSKTWLWQPSMRRVAAAY